MTTERALCEANGCVWDLDPASESRQQWRRDVATVRAAVIEQCAVAIEGHRCGDHFLDCCQTRRDHRADIAKAIRALAD